jgi:GT2 family glycosyltransferase
MIYRRSLLARLGGFSEKYRIASDYDFHLRASAEGHRILLHPSTLVLYDMGGESSQIDRAFLEFEQVHSSLAAEGKLAYPGLHFMARKWEQARIGAFKFLGRSAAGPALRKLWHQYKKL